MTASGHALRPIGTDESGPRLEKISGSVKIINHPEIHPYSGSGKPSDQLTIGYQLIRMIGIYTHIPQIVEKIFRMAVFRQSRCGNGRIQLFCLAQIIMVERGEQYQLFGSGRFKQIQNLADNCFGCGSSCLILDLQIDRKIIVTTIFQDILQRRNSLRSDDREIILCNFSCRNGSKGVGLQKPGTRSQIFQLCKSTF